MEKGNLVFLKQEGDKHHRRDLYIVLEILPTENSLIIAKLLHALSGNQSITFQPHNITYKVKDTDVILSPDQPTFHTQVDEETVDDFYDDNDDLPDLQQKKPHYPYEDFSDDEFETEEIDEENHEENIEEESEYDSFSNDDYDDEADEENSAQSDQELDQENILQENIETRELEINNLIENQEDLGAAGGHDQQEDLDQHRQPRQGDIISFVHQDYWVTAKVKKKPRKNPNSHFYNIELEDGTQTGVELFPPTADTIYSWTLLPQSEWRPQQENLRAAQCAAMGSKEPSPVSQCERREDLTSLYPEQQIQSGRVYSLPSTALADSQLHLSSQAQHHPPSARSKEQHEEYMKIYQKVVRVHQLNPNNPDDENMAHFLVRDQLYLDNNPTFQRLKKAILKKK